MHRQSRVEQTFWRCAFLVVLLCALGNTPVLAHSGDESVVQLQDVPVAAYRLTVMTAPRVLLAGPLHVVVLATDPTGAHFQIIQAMTVEVIPLTGGSHQVSPALPGLTPLGSHEAQFALTQPGRYQIQLHVPDSTQPLTFEVEVVSGVWMQGLLLVLVGVTMLAALWVVREGFTVWRRQPVNQ